MKPVTRARQEKTRREILHRGDLIPPLPELVVRLLALLSRPETEPAELEEHLAQDQVLVGRMLAMVNSPFYGLNRAITGIRDAIMVLGFRGLRSLVLASSAARFMARDHGCYGHDAKGLWKHSLAVGTAARYVASRCGFGKDRCEELLVAGLLHDIGKMLIAPYLADHSVVASTFPGTVVELEQAIVGLDHTDAGALVAAKWNLSELVQEGIKHHHDGEAPPGLERETAVVRLANTFAHKQGIGYLPDSVPDADYLAADLDALGLTRNGWAAFGADLEAAVQGTVDRLARITS